MFTLCLTRLEMRRGMASKIMRRSFSRSWFCAHQGQKELDYGK
jgi:hypothetical protein